MKFVVIGAGGIGAYYGARLQSNGHTVVYVARGEHLKEMQASGLVVTHPEFTFDGPVTACAQDALKETCPANSVDLVIVTLKAMQTAKVMDSLMPWLGTAEVPVLSLQNGVDNELEISRVVGDQRTVGGLAVRIGGHIIEPGVVEATGLAQVVMGAWPNEKTLSVADIPKLAELFNQAGIPTRTAQDMRRELWLKLLINNGVNPLSALTEMDTRTLTRHPVYGRTVYQLMQETAAAAVADEVMLSQQDVDSMYELICTFDAIKTSMLVDLEKGRALEIDEICGAVLRRSMRLGLEAPLNALIDSLLKQKVSFS